jgi:hypothetical protein
VAAVFESPDAPSFPGTSVAAQQAAAAAAAAAGKGGSANHGRVMVVASSRMLSDEWLDKEENAKLAGRCCL